jgi:mannonate dehydratase
MLEQTWRWFGPNDRITLAEIGQTGATGIVTALHQTPVGAIWSKEEILKRKNLIESAGLKWSVVESVPVHEDIKRQSGGYRKYIANYQTTLRNLASAGIDTVCYNFMPVLDWSRTDLVYRFPDKSEVTRFDYVHFAAFDIFILQRGNADESYPRDVVNQAGDFFRKLNVTEIDRLTKTILLGLPGSLEAFTSKELKEMLRSYEGIDNKQLKANLFHFMKEIIPVAEELNIRLAIHPDDPPWSLLGLPRVVSTEKDLIEIIGVADTPVNGLTYCTGSLGAGHFNDVGAMAEKISHRINFAHLRNVTRDKALNFNENYLFGGNVDMYRVMHALVAEMMNRKANGRQDWQIPMRPDHGNQMLGDLGKDNYPGYSLYGRMKSLAEIRGLEIGITRNLAIK